MPKCHDCGKFCRPVEWPDDLLLRATGAAGRDLQVRFMRGEEGSGLDRKIKVKPASLKQEVEV